MSARHSMDTARLDPVTSPVLAREVADHLGAPAPYLADLLKGFVKRGLVTSAAADFGSGPATR